MSNKWTENLKKEDLSKLNQLLNDSLIHKDAILSSKDQEKAQLWCALLELYKKYESLNERLMLLERKLMESERNIKSEEIKLEQDIKTIVEDLENW